MKTINILVLTILASPTVARAQWATTICMKPMSQNMIAAPTYFFDVAMVCWMTGPLYLAFAARHGWRVTTSDKTQPGDLGKKREALIHVLASLLIIATPLIYKGLGFR